MRAFKVTLSSYMVGADGAAVNRDVDLIRAMCISRGVQPGVATITEVSTEELASLPSLRRLIEKKTRPAHGPAASAEERRDLIETLGRVNHGDVAVAHATVAGIESGCGGYLPRTIAMRLLQKFAAAEPETRAAA